MHGAQGGTAETKETFAASAEVQKRGPPNRREEKIDWGYGFFRNPFGTVLPNAR